MHLYDEGVLDLKQDLSLKRCVVHLPLFVEVLLLQYLKRIILGLRDAIYLFLH